MWRSVILALLFLQGSSPLLLLGQGVLPGFETVEISQVETLEERIARLKRELSEAEQALANREEETVISDTPDDSPEVPDGAFVKIRGDGGREGSGFVAKLQGKMFFVTNISILGVARGASLKTEEGQEVKLSNTAFLARERDLAIVPIQWSGAYLRVSPSLRFDEVSIGDAVSVVGISGGAQAERRLRGDIDAISPLKLQISTKFRSGNGGRPVLHDELGSVVAVVSHTYDLRHNGKWLEGSKKAALRRSCFRLDGEVEWQSVPLSELFEQGEAYNRFEERTISLAQAIHMLQYKKSPDDRLKPKERRRALKSYNSHDSIGYLFAPFEEDFDWWGASANSGNNAIIVDRFINGLNNELVTDRKSTRDSLTVEFFRGRINDIDSVRDFSIERLKSISF